MTSKRFAIPGALLLAAVNSASADSLKTAGDVLQIAIPAVAYGATFYTHDEQGRIQFYKSFATNLAATYALKYTVHKTRPNGGKHAFPSGHTSVAFQGAAFIHRRYGFWYALPAYLAAAVVGHSRIKSDEHDETDVIGGAVIGIASSFFFTTRNENFTITPFAGEGTYGVRFASRW